MGQSPFSTMDRKKQNHSVFKAGLQSKLELSSQNHGDFEDFAHSGLNTNDASKRSHVAMDQSPFKQPSAVVS